MDDITIRMERVSMCLRDLWNTYFYVGDDSMSSYPHEVQDLFEEIEVRLFGALFLFDLERLASMGRFRAEPLPFLIVVPARDGTPLLINRPRTDGNWYWDAFHGRVGPTEVTLHFIEWFDWNRYGQRDFQYYLVNVVKFPDRPEFEGRGALIASSRLRSLSSR